MENDEKSTLKSFVYFIARLFLSLVKRNRNEQQNHSRSIFFYHQLTRVNCEDFQTLPWLYYKEKVETKI